MRTRPRDFSIIAMGPRSPEDYRDLVTNLRAGSLGCSAPYCSRFGVTIKEFVSDKSFTILNASESRDRGSKRIRIDWKSPLPRRAKTLGPFHLRPGRVLGHA